jgi:argonaute-like protein implicated in RNA metabolism and viral defense
MNIFSSFDYYEVDYNNNLFKYLHYIRMDTICEVIYVTMKDELTGELLTFDHSGINWIRKMNLTSAIVPLNNEGIAQNQ